MDIDTRLNGRYAECPFFRSHKTMDITCEGVIPDTIETIRFLNSYQRKTQFDNYCCCHYDKCERYMAIKERYDAQ